MNTKIIDLGIGRNYIRNWTDDDAIRKLTQNCIDEGDYEITYDENYMVESCEYTYLSTFNICTLYLNFKDFQIEIPKKGVPHLLEIFGVQEEEFPLSYLKGKYCRVLCTECLVVALQHLTNDDIMYHIDNK